ncbi:MAG: 6-hydroxypseudooxynicotine dehydrogenase complex subunit alpha [Alphaproteobacteria bacterium MarineAlpha11_Bin1]|nr:MAG: 6-hydroxypseudooxynicotine dehydrogenase complex subunit alpha [Alphaproteobacteria bacterium MarineAlpha11_Bin1]|tara:strand:+ start:10134 stop:11018 length:885 start_codon:yes stop_codon:yes gene_type:complete
MKPPPFNYHDPRSIDDAVALLSEKDNAKVLAGGQSLMPMLNMRFVLPDDVIDINKIEELSFIRDDGDALVFGGTTRQRNIEFSDLVEQKIPLMKEAILNVGHRQTRNRGTFGGSLSHLDPSAELPTVSIAQDAIVTVRKKGGDRTIPMADFSIGYMTPSFDLDEMVTDIRVPVWPQGHGYAFVEFARRHGDYAITSSAVLLDVSEGGTISRASVTVGGVGPAPLRVISVEDGLVGQVGSKELFTEIAEKCREIDAMEDVYAPAWYRQHLAAVLTRRALAKAFSRADKGMEMILR